ncbi:hypothetical protein Tco_1525861 [Tanacetum coccineum]
MRANRITSIAMASEEYSPRGLRFFILVAYGKSSSVLLILLLVINSSRPLTPMWRKRLSTVREANAFLALDNDTTYRKFPWVSPIHCVPKKGGFTVVQNEENELIPTRLVTEWRVTFKFPLTLVIKKRPHLLVPTERLPTVACLSAYAIARAVFKVYVGHLSRQGIVHRTFTLSISSLQKDAKAEIAPMGSPPHEFDFKVLDTKGAELAAAISVPTRKPVCRNVLDPKEINETFHSRDVKVWIAADLKAFVFSVLTIRSLSTLNNPLLSFGIRDPKNLIDNVLSLDTSYKTALG